MSEFKREERYIVVKLKHLAGLQVAPLRNFLRENRVPTLDCVVVESDWPEYMPVWQMIERRMTGQPAVTAAEELDAVLHWRGKHAQAIRERDALQQLLNQRDEQVETLKLQNQGEPVAWICHGPEGSGLVALQWSHLPTPTGLVRKIGLCLEQPALERTQLDYGSLDAVQRLAVCRGDVVPVSGSTCNEIREETGQPINHPCKACGGGACIDR